MLQKSRRKKLIAKVNEKPSKSTMVVHCVAKPKNVVSVCCAVPQNLLKFALMELRDLFVWMLICKVAHKKNGWKPGGETERYSSLAFGSEWGR